MRRLRVQGDALLVEPQGLAQPMLRRTKLALLPQQIAIAGVEKRAFDPMSVDVFHQIQRGFEARASGAIVARPVFDAASHDLGFQPRAKRLAARFIDAVQAGFKQVCRFVAQAHAAVLRAAQQRIQPVAVGGQRMIDAILPR